MKSTLAFLLFLLNGLACLAYSDEKAILLVNRNMQKDSIGYNIADDISRVVYDAVQSGQVKLWSSPEKKAPFSKEQLAEAEKASSVRFIHPGNIFIYEIWSVEKGKYHFSIKGISVTSQNANGEDVFLGYVEVNEAMKKILADAYINSNAEGSYGVTLLQAIQSRKFDFDIIFFGSEVIRDMKRSSKIKEEAFKAKNITSKNEIPQAKLVQYSVESGPSTLTEKSDELIRSLEKFFNDNPQEFFNYGGDKIYSYMKKTPVLLSNFEVTEIWTKSSDSFVAKPVQYTLYVLGTALDPIPASQLNAWKVKVDGADFEKEILAKNFYYIIKKINSTAVDASCNEKCRQKLTGKDWNAIMGTCIPAASANK